MSRHPAAETVAERRRRKLAEEIRRRKEVPIEFVLPASHRSQAKRCYETLAAEEGLPAPVSADVEVLSLRLLGSLVTARLLDKSEEQQLFLAMNYARYRADRLRRALRPARSRAADLRAIAALLRDAVRLRNRIVTANLRLVISVARQHTSTDAPLAELVSDGHVSLLRAVEKFDASRGYRFSTYATWALRYNYNRSLSVARRRQRRFVTGDDTFLATAAELPDEHRPWAEQRHIKRSLERMLTQLPPREQQILEARFGLGTAPRQHTLSEVAAQLGVCKERVRQIELRAMGKLRQMAETAQLESLLDR